MKKDIIIIILIVLVLGLGGYLVFDKILDDKVNPDVEINDENKVDDNTEMNDENKVDSNSQTNTDKIENNVTDSVELKNYDISSIKNIEINVPVLGAPELEMKKVIIDNKEEIKKILLNVDEIEEVGKVPEGIGFMTNVSIKINYEGDPSTAIVILNNSNVAINFAFGAGETGYGEYKIKNQNLATELTNKYQN